MNQVPSSATGVNEMDMLFLRPTRACCRCHHPDGRSKPTEHVRAFPAQRANTFFRMAEPVPTGSARIAFSSAAITL